MSGNSQKRSKEQYEKDNQLILSTIGTTSDGTELEISNNNNNNSNYILNNTTADGTEPIEEQQNSKTTNEGLNHLSIKDDPDNYASSFSNEDDEDFAEDDDDVSWSDGYSDGRVLPTYSPKKKKPEMPEYDMNGQNLLPEGEVNEKPDVELSAIKCWICDTCHAINS